VFQVENEYELQLIQQKSDLLDQQSEMATQISQIKKQIKNIDNSLHEVREKRFTGQTAIPFPGVASAASDDA
jgi:predicted phage-related endonuclease